MSWFSRREAVDVAESEPEPVVNRQEELERMLSLIDGRLATLDHQARDFRTQHALRTDRFGQISGMHSASINGFAAVAREWHTLQHQGALLLTQRNLILKEWSALKIAGEHR